MRHAISSKTTKKKTIFKTNKKKNKLSVVVIVMIFTSASALELVELLTNCLGKPVQVAGVSHIWLSSTIVPFPLSCPSRVAHPIDLLFDLLS